MIELTSALICGGILSMLFANTRVVGILCVILNSNRKCNFDKLAKRVS